ncbi:Panacea domain-containing protein [Pseudoclavibacter sp. VKM Ac-2867]|uniref:Panacea domain-containing protein n=1 Tax=Pseudoclavibacter sp. VKM Ac-2867 TaxID=2783829 RepID=UPI00188D6753|nr:type II toxin-antitoxin system antitoxin SocA domain-containing protein [Pseudoclavibacter sp. VKM Ac-2867]MBF4458350.1 DUF4065 domain-containing protein [Pseudoclavibacter sp. VKM Ac-2867]
MSDTTASNLVTTSGVSALDVAKFFIDQDSLRSEPDVTPMKLQKLLYFAQANYLADTGTRLFDDDVEAYDHGPVVHSVWKSYPGRNVIAATHSDSLQSIQELPDDVDEFLQAVWSRFADYSATKLRNITHTQAPWKDHYDPNGFRCRIPDSDMTNWFRSGRLDPICRVVHPNQMFISGFLLDEMDEDKSAARFKALLVG